MKDILKLNDTENILLCLSRLYAKHGYGKFKMSKFEEFDLYANNRSFLDNDKIITFNDFGGRLMALRPDVTLSIVKNVNPDKLPEKVYYSENVYRYIKSANTVKEIMQAGLEYIGTLDSCVISEAILLAAQSLSLLTDSFVLDLSHMGFVSGLLDKMSFPEADKQLLLTLMGNKNAHEIKTLCSSLDIGGNDTEVLVFLTLTGGSFNSVFPHVLDIAADYNLTLFTDELKTVYDVLEDNGFADSVRLDFSVVNDMHYYNGIVFQGFVDRIPFKVLTGGRYDYLPQKLCKAESAIGFAVYIGKIEPYMNAQNSHDSDTCIVYAPGANAKKVHHLAAQLIAEGRTVSIRCGDTAPEGHTQVFYITADGGNGNA